METGKDDKLYDLPEELLYQIYSLLNVRDLVTFGASSKYLHESTDLYLKQQVEKRRQTLIRRYPYLELKPCLDALALKLKIFGLESCSNHSADPIPTDQISSDQTISRVQDGFGKVLAYLAWQINCEFVRRLGPIPDKHRPIVVTALAVNATTIDLIIAVSASRVERFDERVDYIISYFDHVKLKPYLERFQLDQLIIINIDTISETETALLEQSPLCFGISYLRGQGEQDIDDSYFSNFRKSYTFLKIGFWLKNALGRSNDLRDRLSVVSFGRKEKGKRYPVEQP
ncbi:MAG: F-box protein [Deltaproteobacteria bacterium]|nr:MAG: F-box protein [Deltaproteobacteria bacterium]TMQ21147.1 MAG: F-box protein [Deltaproteobacteria bacterium]